MTVETTGSYRPWERPSGILL